MADSTELTTLTDGPVMVRGTFVVKDSEGREFDLSGRDAVALCRCGHSANKPFCDGAHKAAGFQSTVKAD